MTPLRRLEIERIYHAALERPAAARGTFLASACEGNEELRSEVERLLAQNSGVGGIPDRLASAETAEVTGAMVTAGTRLGPYRIEDRIGSGGMGEVFRATDTRLGRTVAIKISQEKFSERFEREER